MRWVWNVFYYSWVGLRVVFLVEDAFRQEVLLAAVLVPLALWVAPDGVGRALMIGSVLFELAHRSVNFGVVAVAVTNFFLRMATIYLR